MTAPKPANLYEKILAIRAAFGPIEKTGKPKEGPQFGFVEASVLAGKFVEALSTFGLIMFPISMEVSDIRLTASGKQNVITLSSMWRVLEVATGESFDVPGIGQGADNSDKAAPKAQTNAMKYAILMLLQAAADDPETDAGTNDRQAEAQAATAARRAAARGEAAPVLSVPAAADAASVAAVEQPIAMATDALKRKIRATGRERGLGDLNLKALAYSVAGKESSKDWTMRDADVILATLDDEATVRTFAALELKAQA